MNEIDGLKDLTEYRKRIRPVKKEFAKKAKQLDPVYERYIAVKVYGKEYAKEIGAALKLDPATVYNAFLGKSNVTFYEIHLHLLKVIEESGINIQPPVSENLETA